VLRYLPHDTVDIPAFTPPNEG